MHSISGVTSWSSSNIHNILMTVLCAVIGDSGAGQPMAFLEAGPGVCMATDGEELMPSIQEALSSDLLSDMDTVLWL